MSALPSPGTDIFEDSRTALKKSSESRQTTTDAAPRKPKKKKPQTEREALLAQYQTGFGGQLSDKRSWERYQNRVAQLEAIERQKARQELYRNKTRERVAARKAAKAAKTASPAPAAAPTPAASAPTSTPQSTQTASPVKPPAPQLREMSRISGLPTTKTPRDLFNTNRMISDMVARARAQPQSQPMDMSRIREFMPTIASMLRDMAMRTPTAQLNALQQPAAPAGPTQDQVAQEIARIKRENRNAPDWEALDRELVNMTIDEQEAYDARRAQALQQEEERLAQVRAQEEEFRLQDRIKQLKAEEARRAQEEIAGIRSGNPRSSILADMLFPQPTAGAEGRSSQSDFERTAAYPGGTIGPPPAPLPAGTRQGLGSAMIDALIGPGGAFGAPLPPELAAREVARASTQAEFDKALARQATGEMQGAVLDVLGGIGMAGARGASPTSARAQGIVDPNAIPGRPPTFSGPRAMNPNMMDVTPGTRAGQAPVAITPGTETTFTSRAPETQFGGFSRGGGAPMGPPPSGINRQIVEHMVENPQAGAGLGAARTRPLPPERTSAPPLQPYRDVLRQQGDVEMAQVRDQNLHDRVSDVLQDLVQLGPVPPTRMTTGIEKLVSDVNRQQGPVRPVAKAEDGRSPAPIEAPAPAPVAPKPEAPAPKPEAPAPKSEEAAFLDATLPSRRRQAEAAKPPTTPPIATSRKPPEDSRSVLKAFQEAFSKGFKGTLDGWRSANQERVAKLRAEDQAVDELVARKGGKALKSSEREAYLRSAEGKARIEAILGGPKPNPK